MRIVIELKRDAVPQVVLNQLYRLTDLQTTFGVINLAIVGGAPRCSTSSETLEHFIEHRRDVVTGARASSCAGRGPARARRGPRHGRRGARERLMKLPLRGLEAFVRRAGRPEPRSPSAAARRLLPLRAPGEGHPRDAPRAPHRPRAREARHRVRRAVRPRDRAPPQPSSRREAPHGGHRHELEEIKERFGDPRRTEIVENEGEIQIEDLIQEEDMVVTISHAGYIKRTCPSHEYRAQRAAARARSGDGTREEDFVSQLFVASTAHSYVFFFTDKGKAT
jgi:DNA gyrase subunit A